MLEGLLNPVGPYERDAFKFAEKVPLILGEIFEETGAMTFPILPAAPKAGLNTAEPFKDEFASLLLVRGECGKKRDVFGRRKVRKETIGAEEEIRNPISQKVNL
jgi:hypothetical protein